MDLERIVADLKRLREDKFGPDSQRLLARKARIGYGKIQRLETGEQKSLSIQDMAAILEACGSSMALYFQQDLTFDEAKIVDEDRVLLAQLRSALKVRRRRKHIKDALEFFAEEDARSARLRKRLS